MLTSRINEPAGKNEPAKQKRTQTNDSAAISLTSDNCVWLFRRYSANHLRSQIFKHANKAMASNLSRASQLCASRARVLFNLVCTRRDCSFRQDLDYLRCPTDAFGQAWRTLTSTGKLQKRPLDDTIFKRMKTDDCKT